MHDKALVYLGRARPQSQDDACGVILWPYMKSKDWDCFDLCLTQISYWALIYFIRTCVGLCVSCVTDSAWDHVGPQGHCKDNCDQWTVQTYWLCEVSMWKIALCLSVSGPKNHPSPPPPIHPCGTPVLIIKTRYNKKKNRTCTPNLWGKRCFVRCIAFVNICMLHYVKKF